MRKTKAQAVLLAITLLALIATVSLVGSRVIVNDIRNTSKTEDTAISFFSSEAGIQDGLVRLKFNSRFADGYTQDNQFCTLINLDTGGENLNCGQENDSNKFQNHLYSLKIWQTTVNPISKERVLKDQILEFNLPKDLMGKRLTISWTNPQDDNPSTDDSPIKAMVSAKILDVASSLPNQFIAEEINTVTSTNTLYVDLPAAPSPSDLRLKIRPYFVDTSKQNQSAPSGYYFNISISAPTNLNQGETIIESTGFYRGTKRTLQAKVDTTTGQVVNLLDYAIFVGEGDLTR